MIDFEERRDELLEKIEEMTRRKQYKALRDILVELEPADIADLFDDLPEEMLPLLFRLLPKEPAAELFVELEPDVQEMLIRGFSNTELKEVLDELYLDDAVDIVEEMPAGVVKRILKHADPDTRKSINEILKYPEDSAGALMTTEFVDLKRDMTVEDALKRIRRTGTDKETINVCYVVDPARKLLGIVSLRTILLSDEDDIIENIMETHVISVGTLEDKEDVAQTFSKYDFIALPVVDKEDRLVGIVTVDDALDVMDEEHEEDLQIAGSPAGANPDERGGLLVQLLSSEMWLFFWAIGVVACGVLTHLWPDMDLAGVSLAFALPVALRGADAMVHYVINSFLEYDEDDEDAPTLLGFAVKGVVVSAIFAVLVMLLFWGVRSIMIDPKQLESATLIPWYVPLLEPIECGFKAAACSVVFSFATAPLYLLSLRSNDRQGKDTSGVSLRGVGMAVALAVFILAAFLVMVWM